MDNIEYRIQHNAECYILYSKHKQDYTICGKCERDAIEYCNQNRKNTLFFCPSAIVNRSIYYRRCFAPLIAPHTLSQGIRSAFIGL